MLVAAYLIAIVAANLLVATFGPSVTIINAFLFIGLDITTRDHLHDRWLGRNLWLKMAVMILAGSWISYMLNRAALPVAIASWVAFAASGLVDTLTYHLLRGQSKAVQINGSNVASALVDSLLFPILAFGFPVLWPIVAGQFAAKVFGGALWAWLLARRATQSATA